MINHTPLRLNWKANDRYRDHFSLRVSKQEGSCFLNEDIGVLREFLEFACGFFDLSSVRSRVENLKVSVVRGAPPQEGQLGEFSFRAARSEGVMTLYEDQMVDNLDLLLEAAAHEIIHCKQWAFSELDWSLMPNGAHSFLWMSQPSEHLSQEYADYINCPWEQEALNNQAQLVDIFRRRSLEMLDI